MSCKKYPTVWASLQSSYSLCGSSESQAASILWHSLLNIMLLVHSAGEGNMEESAAGIQCVSPEVTAVISVDMLLAIN